MHDRCLLYEDSRKENGMANGLSVVGGVAAGLGLMYFLDPDQGRRRRALVKDQMVHAAHKTGDAMDATSRDIANRAKGAVAELRGRFQSEEVSDDVLRERVRARVGAVVGHASSIGVSVSDGRVTLSGPVLAHEVARLLRRVAAVRGVREVEDRLEVHTEPGDIPGLQGAARVPRGGEVFDLMQRNWSPSTRFFTGLAGIGLAMWGLRRLDAFGIAMATVGVGLCSRAIANIPISSLSVDAGRRAIRR
jgi:osmotically-inducible protein OsmY